MCFGDRLGCFPVCEYLREAFLATVSGIFVARRLTSALASSTIELAGLVRAGQGLACPRIVLTCAGKAETSTKKHDLTS